ncbi:MAG: hypothetical protein ACE5FO_09505 [Parvularculaceae bacterium]
MTRALYRLVRGFLLSAASGFAVACATADPGGPETGERIPQWAANGYLTPGRTDEPEIVGLYLTKKACEAALDAWMSRQVVGNPVSGECLPIDRH